MLSILNALLASVTSSNSLLHELVQQKRKSTSSETADSPAKRKERDSDESGRAIAIALEKAKTIPSKEVHDSALDEALDSASDEAYPKLQGDDTLSLFSDYSLVDEQVEPEDELNNDELLTQITTSLGSCDESGPPVSNNCQNLLMISYILNTVLTNEKRCFKSIRHLVQYLPAYKNLFFQI